MSDLRYRIGIRFLRSLSRVDTLMLALLVISIALGALALALGLVMFQRVAAQARSAGSVEPGLRAIATRLEVIKEQGVDTERDLKQDLAIARNEQANAAQTLRSEVGDRVTQFAHVMQDQLRMTGDAQAQQLRAFGDRFAQLQKAMHDQLVTVAQAQNDQAKLLADAVNALQQHVRHQLNGAAALQGDQLKAFGERLSQLTQVNEQRFDALRHTLEQRLDVLRAENAKKLEEMRHTVDEKLQTTLEQRLGESFKLVSDRLEQVHRGLGEMQNLAAGVGDLKRVLTNVKSRGVWGEVQLSTLLAEALTPHQYATNVETVPGSNKRVEFAIRLPGRGDDGKPCWLPVDCKFPLEDWRRLHDALERADAAAAEEARKSLMDFLRQQARTIRNAYIAPPLTTDFALLFVPTEGLYAEIMARPGFAETLQREYRVVVSGPTNFLALLNSLQMGFRTLAIEQRSSEVWKVLGAVKTEFGKFGEILANTKKRLEQVGRTLDDAGRKSTTIARKLREVEALPQAEADRLLVGEIDAGVESVLGRAIDGPLARGADADADADVEADSDAHAENRAETPLLS